LKISIKNRYKLFNLATVDGEYLHDVTPTESLLGQAENMGADIFSFIERTFINRNQIFKNFTKEEDNAAILTAKTYEDWWSKQISKKSRNMVRKAGKKSVVARIFDPDEEAVRKIWEIYNETPIRQERRFSHYGISLDAVRKGFANTSNNSYLIGAYCNNELIGLLHLLYHERVALISQILSFQRHFDKAPNNALISKTLELCTQKNIRYIIYGRMGSHPSLDRFKQSNGFVKFIIPRYYIPLTRKGNVIVKLRLHREIEDALPQSIKYSLIPIYNWLDKRLLSLTHIS